MKELSVEEKARRYDEAKLRISAAYNSNRCTISFMNEIFPELQVSEDERIKKEIINYFQCQSRDEPCRKDTHNRWIAWLEKQGQKPQGKSAFEAANEEKVDNQNCVNPADKSKIKPKFKTGDRVIGIVSGMQYFITKVCDDRYNTESGCIIMFCSQDNFELYERNPAEWSEDDENRFNNLCLLIDASNDNELTKNGFKNWLKSIKERYTWKPNDEQMKALNNIIVNGHMFYSRQERELMNLYNDLKNLIKK